MPLQKWRDAWHRPTSPAHCLVPCSTGTCVCLAWTWLLLLLLLGILLLLPRILLLLDEVEEVEQGCQDIGARSDSHHVTCMCVCMCACL